MEELAVNLKDAGCDAECISEICQLYEIGDMQGVIKKLYSRRCDLMNELHESQGKLDCLDFLIRKIRKNQLL